MGKTTDALVAEYLADDDCRSARALLEGLRAWFPKQSVVVARDAELLAKATATLAEARRAAEDRVAEVDAQRRAARAALAETPGALLGRQAEKFERWAEGERARRNMDLARLTAQWMDRRATAARAYGQGEVLDKLAEKARNEAREEAARRKLADQPPDLARN